MAKIDRVQEVSLELLRPYENNAKIHSDKQVKQIAESIKEFGFLSPCLIDEDFNIVAGHGRVMAAEMLGLKTVPCVFIEGLTETQRRAYILADNRLTELGEWDFDKVQLELRELADMDFDIELTGFEIEDYEEPKEIIEDDFSEEVEPITKLGDIWQLGRHRLICGDSTDALLIQTLLENKNADLLLTDPPYGINVVGGGGSLRFGKVGGDNVTHFGKVGGGNIVESKVYSAVIGDDTTETAKKGYEVAKELTDNQIIFGGNYFTDFLYPSRCWIVWDKQNTGNFADAELAWTSFDKGVKLYHYLWNGLARQGSRVVEGVTRVHPTQKPVGLFSNILNDFSKEGDAILDLFGGSGSTLIACEQINRTCFMAELDPHYCDIIINRWETFTGEKAVLLNE